MIDNRFWEEMIKKATSSLSKLNKEDQETILAIIDPRTTHKIKEKLK